MKPYTQPNFSADELAELGRDLRAMVYYETSTKLEIYQRAQLLNGTPYVEKSASRRSSLAKVVKGLGRNAEMKNMPSAKVLNEIKLQKELDSLRRIYAVASSELTKTESEKEEDVDELTHAQLWSAIEGQQQNNNELEKLIDALRSGKETFKTLKFRIADERQESDQRLAVKEDRIEELRHQRRNVRLVNNLELELVVKWEGNRCSQASILGDNEQRSLMRQIADLKRCTADEERLIREVENFRGKQFDEFRTKIKAWQKKYFDGMALKEAETQAHEKRIRDVCKADERHHQTYAERVEMVSEYLATKAEEQRLFEQQMHRVECAVRLQAWWRGVMVRKGLGPYRKKSKKGKKGKGKGK